MCENCFFTLTEKWNYYNKHINPTCPICRSPYKKKGGLITHSFEPTTESSVKALVLTPNNTFVALVSYSETDAAHNTFHAASFMKYHHDGSPYTSFGDNGITKLKYHNYITLNALVLKPSDGSLFATGIAFNNKHKKKGVCIVALSAQGMVKKIKMLSFKKNETTSSSKPHFFPKESSGTAITITPDGMNLFIAGYLYNKYNTKNMFLTKVQSDTLEEDKAVYTATSSITDSTSSFESIAHALAITSKEIIIVAGLAENRGLMKKGYLRTFNKDGTQAFVFNQSLNPAFYEINGSDPLRKTIAHSITINQNGSFHVLGTESGYANYSKPYLLSFITHKRKKKSSMYEYTPQPLVYLKNPNHSFLEDKIEADTITINNVGTLLLSCNRKIKIALYKNNNLEIDGYAFSFQRIIMRLMDDNETVDQTFDMHKTIERCEQYETAPKTHALLTLPDNSIIVGGSNEEPIPPNNYYTHMTLMKLNPTGDIDYNFGQTEEH